MVKVRVLIYKLQKFNFQSLSHSALFLMHQWYHCHHSLTVSLSSCFNNFFFFWNACHPSFCWVSQSLTWDIICIQYLCGVGNSYLYFISSSDWKGKQKVGILLFSLCLWEGKCVCLTILIESKVLIHSIMAYHQWNNGNICVNKMTASW